MAYSKKSLLIFSTVALSTAAIAGFFIRQKVLNDWKIAEFNDLLKQIKELETEILKNKKELEDSEKLKINKEGQIQKTKEDIEKLEESISKNNEKLSELELQHASWKKNIKFAKILKIYRKLKENTKDSLKKVRSSIPYWRTISYHINNEKNMSNQINEYKFNQKTKQEEKENLNKKMEKNSVFLKQLEEIISKLKENLNIQTSKLTFLKSQEREREREREAS